jgi:hypothetical protein
VILPHDFCGERSQVLSETLTRFAFLGRKPHRNHPHQTSVARDFASRSPGRTVMNRRHTRHVPRPVFRSGQRQAARSVRLSFESLEDRLMLDVGRESKRIRSRLL